ncbi:MAG TPA: serine--tRNA ligase [Candidatus Saccharimonadales bacterium]|jgi:seryl-tRNA synthetase
MIDIQLIRDNPSLVAEKSKLKGYEVDITQLLGFDDERRQLNKQVDELRQKRNELSGKAKGQKPDEEQIEEGKKLKEELSKLEHQLSTVDKEYQALLENVPNIIPDDTPKGGEEDNKTEKTWGEPRQDEVQDHLAWGESRDLIDMERGAKVAGNKFYFLKGSLVQLELAVFQYGLDVAAEHGFTPITVPHLVSTNVLKGTGFAPKSEVEDQVYKVEGEDLNLIGTSEIPITGYYAGEILEESKLPILFAGISPAYRREAGAYGKFSRGLYRVHQFNKLELYVFCKPEDSESWHKKLIEIEEQLCQALEIPYQLVRIAAGDLGMPAYKKYDIEYWSPVDKSYRELMSCSNVTDFQARSLGIRYRKADGTTSYVNTLNGTAAAFSRVCIAIIENNQTKDGLVKVPKVLQQYLGGRTVL